MDQKQPSQPISEARCATFCHFSGEAARLAAGRPFGTARRAPNGGACLSLVAPIPRASSSPGVVRSLPAGGAFFLRFAPG